MGKRVQFKGGYTTILQDDMADRLEKKGEVEILEEDVDPMVNNMPAREVSPADLAGGGATTGEESKGGGGTGGDGGGAAGGVKTGPRVPPKK